MPGGSSRPRRWSLLLVLLLLVVPLLEVVVIIAVGRAIGGWPTFALLLAESAFGAWLVRREGSRSWRGLQEALTSGRMPSRQLADAALVLVGGVLLLAPGFLTDVLGFFLVLPFTRPLARGLLEAAVARRLLAGTVGGWPGGPAGPAGGAGAAGDVIEGQVIEGEAL
ncbi:MAG: FxsA family protein [Actinomycetota bacterium]|nr:FxsA family protein [Actinomycetota bacterium]